MFLQLDPQLELGVGSNRRDGRMGAEDPSKRPRGEIALRSSWTYSLEPESEKEP